ncbi:MAG: type II toxin-antitoxin system death-on-curing family toxin [Pseudonocardia sp.]
MSYCLSLQVVMDIHAGFPDGGELLKPNELQGALTRPTQEVFGLVPYPSATEKAAVLLHGVACAHSFLDANKRTAWLCCTTYLDLNGIQLGYIPPDEVTEFVVSVVQSEVSHTEIVDWLLDRQV